MGDGGALVSVGLPVRNGGDALANAIEGLLAQTYTNLEIVISDNASTDDTEPICRAFAARDSRIRYVRQPAVIPVMENFRFAFEQTRGDFFLFASHDDLRSANYVETLVAAFREHPEAALAASDFVGFQHYEAVFEQPLMPHDFETTGLGLLARLRKQTRVGCEHVYGLINARHMRGYSWREDVGWDVPFLAFLAERGPFVYRPGAIFYYRRIEEPAPLERRARETSAGRVRRWPIVRTAWLTARAMRDAGSWRPAVVSFPIVLYVFMQGARGIAAAIAPRAVRVAARTLSGRSHG
jgi:glycosyltransferase involved in cell wall biosynthesis